MLFKSSNFNNIIIDILISNNNFYCGKELTFRAKIVMLIVNKIIYKN
jgi:hypothetical protein